MYDRYTQEILEAIRRKVYPHDDDVVRPEEVSFGKTEVVNLAIRAEASILYERKLARFYLINSWEESNLKTWQYAKAMHDTDGIKDFRELMKVIHLLHERLEREIFNRFVGKEIDRIFDIHKV